MVSSHHQGPGSGHILLLGSVVQCDMRGHFHKGHPYIIPIWRYFKPHMKEDFTCKVTEDTVFVWILHLLCENHSCGRRTRLWESETPLDCGHTILTKSTDFTKPMLFYAVQTFPASKQDSKLQNFPQAYSGVRCSQHYIFNFLLHIKASMTRDIIIKKCTA